MIHLKYEKLAEQKLRKAMFSSADKIVKATAGAISDTTKNLRTEASKQIRAVFNLEKKAVDKRIHRVFISKNRGGIRIRTGRPISLSQLTRAGKAKQRKIGVSYVLRKGQTTIIRSAFGPKITKLHGSVYTRVGKGRKPLSIKQYKDLALDLHALNIVSRLTNSANEFMRKNIKRRLNLLRLREEGKVK